MSLTSILFCSYAPFGSFNERKIGGDGPSGRNSGDDMPGPGTYQQEQASQQRKAQKKPVSGSAFTSKVSIANITNKRC